MKRKTLQDFRKEKNLTQEEVAKLLGITKEYLSMLERGYRNPSDKLKKKMAELYKVKAYDIFLATEETKCFSNNI